MAKNKNKTKICGKKPKIANNPPKTPSTIKPFNQVGAPLNHEDTVLEIKSPHPFNKLAINSQGEAKPFSLYIAPLNQGD